MLSSILGDIMEKIIITFAVIASVMYVAVGLADVQNQQPVPPTTILFIPRASE